VADVGVGGGGAEDDEAEAEQNGEGAGAAGGAACGGGRVARLRAALDSEYSEQATLYSDEYLQAVLSAPDRKNPKKQRMLAYARDKLFDALKWRREIKADDLTPDEELCAATMACCSLYWHGFDPEGRPVLWAVPSRNDWKNLSIEGQVKMHVLMLDWGVKQMPKGVHTFNVSEFEFWRD
jgi:hypothetical protein